MYRFYIRDDGYEYHYAELCRVFLSEGDFEIISMNRLPDPELLSSSSYVLGADVHSDRDSIKRYLYIMLGKLTGMKPEWGTLTGVRPLKPALDILDKCGHLEDMKLALKDKYLLSDSKADLLGEIAEYQLKHVKGNPSDCVSVYTGIPFCPTRCEYCSFASNVAGDEEIERYLVDLKREIIYTGQLYQEDKKDIESIYIGGGTPTTLSSSQLKELIESLSDAFTVN
ncbi:MAG: hypothetical protein IJH57_00255, partial [Mogibacterium sp.]|nr:hypothetical protein [Mogibacterium sp.]